MLKKIWMLLVVVAMTGAAMAQSVEDAKKFLYYQRYNSATEALQKIIDKNSGNTEAYYWMFLTKLEEGDTTAARQALQQVEQLKQANSKLKVDPLVDAGQVHMLMIDDKKDEAMQQSAEVVKDTRSKNAGVLMALAKAQIDARQGEGNYDYALELLEAALKRDKKNPEIRVLMGDAWRRKGDGGKAVSAYMEAEQVDPSYAKANYSIARIYVTQNNLSSYVKHFLDAIRQDPAYAPAYYELYYHFYFRDVNEAKDYLEKYIANTDKTVDNDYMMVDLLYASKKNQEAIDMAKDLLVKQGATAKPRIYKLIAYSYDAMGDSAKALENINTYFDKEKPGNYLPKDYTLKAKLITKMNPEDSATRVEAIALWQNAVNTDTLKANKADYMQHIAAAYKKMGNRSKEAYWLGKIYEVKESPSNVDLYYWGLAHYAAGEYPQADSVFAIYTNEYPDHVHGYLWRAKASAVIDSTMEQGLAVPHYAKVIEIADDDAEKNKALLIQAYGYIGAYQANVKKDYPVALENFEHILQLQPNNTDAARYSEILKGWIEQPESETGEAGTTETEASATGAEAGKNSSSGK